MENPDTRTALVLGEDGLEKLHHSHVAIFGVGGVGGYVCEALVRVGIGEFDIIDNDVVSISNLNRQIIATMETLGKPKVEVMKARMLSIVPNAKITTHQTFFLPQEKDNFPFASYDYIVDAVDNVTAKITLIEVARECHTPIISSMGTGNRLDPSQFCISDITKTHTCPLARVMRRELKKRDISSLKVVWSPEKPVHVDSPVPGSTSFCPPVAGMLIAGEVVRDITGVLPNMA